MLRKKVALTKTNQSLKHYASEFYDPVKAHEYYLRTRELKEKRSKMTVEERETEGRQNQAISFVNKQIAEKRTEALDKGRVDQQTKLEALQKTAQESADRISEQLKTVFEGIETNMAIPASASPKLQAFLNKQRRLRATGAKDQAQKELKKLGDDLKVAMKTAREEYASARKAMVDKYSQARVTEAENIRKNIK